MLSVRSGDGRLAMHVIPTGDGFRQESMLLELVSLGMTVHASDIWSILEAQDVVIAFCNAEFLESLPEIGKRTKKTAFVNCMT